MFPPMRQLVRLGQTIQEWPVASQQRARRNAMVALTACADRRAEREDVASYFAERAERTDGPTPAATPDPGVVARA